MTMIVISALLPIIIIGGGLFCAAVSIDMENAFKGPIELDVTMRDICLELYQRNDVNPEELRKALEAA